MYTTMYPTNIPSRTNLPVWIDNADDVESKVINDPVTELIATQTELGQLPKGSTASVAARLAVSLNDDGTIKSIAGLAPDTQNTYARTQYLIPYAATTTSFGEIAIGTATHVLTSNGIGSAPTFQAAAAGGGGAFTLDTAVIREDVSGAGDYATDDFVVGSPQLADDGNADHDTRMWFDKSRGAFRAGRVVAADWDDANVGIQSAAFGYNNECDGPQAFSAGRDNNVDGLAATALGRDLKAERYYTFAMGFRAYGFIEGQLSHAVGYFSNKGDCQYSRLVCRAQTSDETPEVILPNDADNKLIIPANQVWRVDGTVVATISKGASIASWSFQGLIHRDGSSNTTLDWSTVSIDYNTIDVAVGVTLSANDTNEALNINITGKAATTIRWTAVVHLTHVGY